MAQDLVVQYAFTNATTSGATNIVPVQPGQRIIVLQCCVITGNTNNVQFQSNASTSISATFPLAPNGGFVLPYSELGWFQTNIGETLDFNMGTGTMTGVQVVWCPRSV